MSVARVIAKSARGELQSLLDWLVRGGAFFPRLGLATDGEDGERRAVARGAIAAGDVVLVVPASHVLTATVAAASPIGREIAATGIELAPHVYLAAALLEERAAPRSFWSAYVHALPESFAHLPVLFGEAELALLEGSGAAGEALWRRAALRAEYRDLAARCPRLARFSFVEWRWARLAVSSRCFRIRQEGVETFAMVPLADMLDHAPAAPTTWGWDDGERSFVVSASSAIAAGAEVHDSYGPRSNRRSLFTYGFCTPDNPHDEVELPGSARLTGDTAAEARGDLLTTLRLSCLDEADEAALAGSDPAGRGRRLISFANERRVLLALADLARAALAGYPTSAAEDAETLERPGLGRTERACLNLRVGEKRVLARWLELADRLAPLLDGLRADFVRAASCMRARGGPVGEYLDACMGGIT